MKKISIWSFLALAFFVLVSWGPEGHSTIALIAQSHLTPQAKQAVEKILNNQPMSSISSYADQYRETHPQTGDWHFLNLELGLSQSQFKQFVLQQTKPNVYIEINKEIAELSNPKTSKAQKKFDLEFLIHFVGDAHQPMHISRAEDRGGNDITVTYDGKSTNVHKIWDSLLLNDDQPDFTTLATKIDKATPTQIKKWQSDDIIQWLWESYQASSKVYANVHNGMILDHNYYLTNIKTAETRLEMGGIRLAGVLNKIYH